ncbi:hypothetical protein DPMN_005863 [Dreissena polymorpha]|nr:hypothetical protein DPMN_005863 [Dreissena polymorpha]
MDVLCAESSQHSHYCLSVSAWIYLTLGVHSIIITAFCVSMDISCSVCSQHSHDCHSVSAWMYCAVFTAKSLLPFCVSMGVSCSVLTAKSLLPFCVSMDVLCSGCSRPSHYCLSVSAWMYRALGVHSIVITAFLCQHIYILLWVFTA